MNDALHGEALGAIEGIFADRMKQSLGGEEDTHNKALADVLPVSAHEVELLAKVAERYSCRWSRWVPGRPSIPPAHQRRAFWSAST